MATVTASDNALTVPAIICIPKPSCSQLPADNRLTTCVDDYYIHSFPTVSELLFIRVSISASTAFRKLAQPRYRLLLDKVLHFSGLWFRYEPALRISFHWD